jgi:hypothetical protein
MGAGCIVSRSVGDYRIIYAFDLEQNKIHLLAIEHRRELMAAEHGRRIRQACPRFVIAFLRQNGFQTGCKPGSCNKR